MIKHRNIGMSNRNSCVILWDLPSSPLDPNITVLSFLPPHLEHRLLTNSAIKEVVTMAKVMDQVKSDARKLYIEFVADIGLFKLPNGKTFRKALRGKGKTSLWWYHPITFRNSENEPTYANILSILAVSNKANKCGFKYLHLVRPPADIINVLKSCFKISVIQPIRYFSWLDLVRGLLGRFRFLYMLVKNKLALSSYYKPAHQNMDIAFQGFWDWSVYADSNKKKPLNDNYFGDLPHELTRCGKKIGYWCWYDPKNKPGIRKRSHQEVLKPLRNQNSVLLLPALLKLKDIITIGLDFRTLFTVFSAIRQKPFKQIFWWQKLNFYPLFKRPLIRGFLSSGIPECRLFEIAAIRAQAITQPTLTVRFQEHNPPSRAIYAAVQSTHTNSWAIQHASYNSGKTYLAIHPNKEFAPQSDGQSIPHPDRICVMGGLGKKLFSSCGYDLSNVMLSGSPRYDHVQLNKNLKTGHSLQLSKQKTLRVLVATSLPAKTDFLLVATAVEAVKGMPHDSVSLRLRQHPYDRMEKLSGFSQIEPWLNLSKYTLDEDFSWADLVLISQSTVGEEAFLAGKQVWQVRFPYPDQSALAEVSGIPCFYSIPVLRAALKNTIAHAESIQPNMVKVNEVYQALFQTSDQKPSKTIANLMCKTFDNSIAQ
jgi:hypothetical protein